MPNKRYTPKFKQNVVEAVLNKGLNYKEAQKQFEIGGDSRIRNWEQIYLMEGAEELSVERRARHSWILLLFLLHASGYPRSLCFRRSISPHTMRRSSVKYKNPEKPDPLPDIDLKSELMIVNLHALFDTHPQTAHARSS